MVSVRSSLSPNNPKNVEAVFQSNFGVAAVCRTVGNDAKVPVPEVTNSGWSDRNTVAFGSKRISPPPHIRPHFCCLFLEQNELNLKKLTVRIYTKLRLVTFKFKIRPCHLLSLADRIVPSHEFSCCFE